MADEDAQTTRQTFSEQVGALPDDVKAPLLDFDLALRDVEEQVGKLTERDWSELTRGMSALETARLNVTCAYTLNTLFFIYLKTQGVSTSDHPVKQELDRVRQYLKKVKGMSSDAEQQKANVRLNAEAAKRFITHALGEPAALLPDAPASGVETKRKRDAAEGSKARKGKKSKK
ncbi:hypothetical protein KFE25_007598 [Diacronema lutheri]|uniref:Nuclear nucleic acid-binding protein C1D n=2 Tax=Diacronema lutheri TaxID=2081491 RepID=A0A8J5XW76_DIALT|nr:hypothetical protein KFE25_007598 [Diacronema lutheri]